jgi:hypothetical protein
VLLPQNGMDHALQILVPGDSPVPIFPVHPRYGDKRESQKKDSFVPERRPRIIVAKPDRPTATSVELVTATVVNDGPVLTNLTGGLEVHARGGSETGEQGNLL